MKKIVLATAGIVIAWFSSTGVVLAEEDAIQTMARIAMSLNHFPSDDDKATLMEIVDSDETTEEEADIAMALANIEHKVLEKDTERLANIVSDEKAGADARTLASILLRINHSPSAEDKTALAALADE